MKAESHYEPQRCGWHTEKCMQDPEKLWARRLDVKARKLRAEVSHLHADA